MPRMSTIVFSEHTTVLGGTTTAPGLLCPYMKIDGFVDPWVEFISWEPHMLPRTPWCPKGRESCLVLSLEELASYPVRTSLLSCERLETSSRKALRISSNCCSPGRASILRCRACRAWSSSMLTVLCILSVLKIYGIYHRILWKRKQVSKCERQSDWWSTIFAIGFFRAVSLHVLFSHPLKSSTFSSKPSLRWL